MSVNLSVNGITYPYPENGDINWGTQATAWATAVSNGTLQKNGGTFTLTADANFGATYGLVSKYFKSQSGNIALSGVIRLANTDAISFRNGANTADLPISVVADKLRFNGAEFVDTTSSQTLTNKDYVGNSLTIGGGAVLTTTDATGTGNLVKATSPTLVTPTLGVATATSIAIGGGSAITTSNATGTGNLVKDTSPTLTTPTLGVATATSIAVGGGTALTTTNATGTGNLVKATSPTLTTPVLGVATASSLNGITFNTSTATVTLANSSSLTTVGAYGVTLTSQATTNLTLPTAGTLLSDTSTATVSGKTFSQVYTVQNATKFYEYQDGFVNNVISGLVPATSGSLTSNIPSGYAYISGVRVVMGITNKTWTASRDTYADLSPTGTWTFVEVTNGAAAPAITSGSMRIFKLVTNGTAVTAVTNLKVYTVAYGNIAGQSITTGYDNTFIGDSAGQAVTTGFSNACFGSLAGYSLSTGYENVCFGPYAGRNNSSGFDNVFIGTQAGYYTTSADNNVFIGYNAGVTGTSANAVTTGGSNIFIGSNAGPGSTAQRTNSIGIGKDVTVTADNQWVVGKIGTKQGIKEGSNAAMGVSTLVGGTVTVSNTLVTANSRIFLSTNTSGGTVGHPYISARTAGTSFTITSTSVTDTSTIAWEIKEPA